MSLTPNRRQTRTFNQSGIFRGHQFVTTAWKSDPNDTTKQAIDCGMYPSQYAPSEDQTAAGDESRRTDWSRIDLCIECKLHPTKQDPFDERNEKNEPEAKERRQVLGQILSYAQLVSKHQQRTFHYMLLLFRECARVIRSDQSSVVVTEKIRYDTDGPKLSEFLARYGRLRKDEFRGIDPTAVRIEETDELYGLVHEYAEKSVAADAEDHAARLFKASLVDSWPLWQLEVHDEESNTVHWYVVGKPSFKAHGILGRCTRGYVGVELIDGELDGKFVYLKDTWRVVVTDPLDESAYLRKEGEMLKRINEANVAHVPTLVAHGDIQGQETQVPKASQKVNDKREHRVKKHQHYRLVVEEIGKPLSQFKNSGQLVLAMHDCIQCM